MIELLEFDLRKDSLISEFSSLWLKSEKRYQITILRTINYRKETHQNDLVPFLSKVKKFLKLSHLYTKETLSVARGQKQICIKNAKKQFWWLFVRSQKITIPHSRFFLFCAVFLRFLVSPGESCLAHLWPKTGF